MKAITLEDILQKPKMVEIPVHGKTVMLPSGIPETAKLKFWIRTAKQPERDLAAAYARKESRTLRKKLETDGTEERQILVLDELEGASDDSLKALWVTDKVVMRALTLRQNSLEDRDKDYVPEPEADIITPKMMDDYENELEAVEDAREMGVIEAIESAREELEKEVENVPVEDLMKLAIPSQIESILTRAYESSFILQLIFRCTFEDAKLTKPAFKAIEQVERLSEDALTILTNAHTGLLLDPEQVKNWAGGLKR